MATVVASYFLVKNLSDEYISRTQIATGIVDASRHLLDKDNTPNAQQDEITREFSNLTEIIKLKKLIDNVSYQLMIHDLTSPVPFRKFRKDYQNLKPAALQYALATLRDKLLNGQPLSVYNKGEKGLNDLLVSQHYDERSLRKDLDISRDGESDFISVTFTSDNPQLSAFVVNTLCKEFIDYYSTNIKRNEANAVAFLSNLLTEKRNALNEKKDALQKYKIDNGILNLDEQSKSIFDQILVYTDKKLQAEKDIASYEGAVKSIEQRFNPKDRKYIESTISQYNQAITNTEEQLHALNTKYVHEGFNPKYKPALDSIQRSLTRQINNSSDKYITNPLVAKDDLVRQKMQLEVSRDLAKYSVKSIDDELAILNAKFNRLVPFDATVKTYGFDIDIASKEYLDVLNKYNSTNLQSNFAIKLLQIEPATPNTAEPSKKMLLILLSGIISLVLCLLVIFILFYLDDNINDPLSLVNKTQLPLIGELNLINGGAPDLKKLWDVEHRNKMQHFKELLRAVRFEIDQELKGEKIIGVTSLNEGVGKTIFATSLAYSYAAINKKVLLIDGNFNNPAISNSFEPQLFAEDYFKQSSYIEKGADSPLSVLGNRGGDITLLEISNEQKIKNELTDLKSRFDIILIDLPPLNALNKAKEWLLFTSKAIVVFEANQRIHKEDQQFIDYLKNLNSKFAGWVLNKVIDKKSSKKSKN